RPAATLAEVVELGLANVTATLDADGVDLRAVGLEGTLDADPVGHLAHGEGGVQAAVALADHHALESLQALAGALLDPDLNGDGIAGGKRRHLLAHLLGFERLDHLVLAAHDMTP